MRRTRNAARSVMRETPRCGPIWAVSMVKNEADIIGETLENLFVQGVDQILVADNRSTDNTREVLANFPIHIVDDPIPAYWQGEKMSHLARAATRAGAAWIIPFDADELWKGTDGRTIAEVLRNSNATIVEAEWWDFVPKAEADTAQFAVRFPYRLAQQHFQAKVAFRANWLARIAIGNHGVSLPDPSVGNGLRIAHYRYRSPAQMIQKARDGSASSRLAGIEVRTLPQWFTLEHESEDTALARIAQMIAEGDLVYDPASEW